jgi:hypothetical protein
MKAMRSRKHVTYRSVISGSTRVSRAPIRLTRRIRNGEGGKIISIVIVMSCLIQIIITRKVARVVVLVVPSIDNT